jgi:hypothetical protein
LLLAKCVKPCTNNNLLTFGGFKIIISVRIV